MTKKYIIKNYTDLANPILGTKIISYSDEFFAPAKRIISPLKPIFKENVFDSHGKWMDGWETRRRRSPGFDFVIIKLGKPGKIKTVDIDTSFFNGNQPEYAQLEGCYSNNDNVKNIKWTKIIKKQKIKPNSSNLFKSLNLKTFTHVKLNIFPDGGVARLRLFGNIDLSLHKFSKNKNIDLANIVNGSEILACSDEHFGNANNLILPSKSINMGNGWETRRRRGKGFDWVLIKLGYPGKIDYFEIGTHFFKGNYPDSFSIQAFSNNKKFNITSLIKNSNKWATLISNHKLKANANIRIKNTKYLNKNFNFIKLNIYPDGGISRFRVFGKV